MNNTFKEIQKIGLSSIVKIQNVEQAVPLAQILCKGGVPCAEVTFRTNCASEVITAF